MKPIRQRNGLMGRWRLQEATGGAMRVRHALPAAALIAVLLSLGVIACAGGGSTTNTRLSSGASAPGVTGTSTSASQTPPAVTESTTPVTLTSATPATVPQVAGLTCVRMSKGKPYGFIDQTGKVVIPLKFRIAHDFTEGLAAASIDGKHFGYIDTSGSWVIKPTFQDAWPFSDGLGRVITAGKVGYVDKTGAWVIEPRDWASWGFSDGLAVVASAVNGKEMTGYIDKTGAWVIEPREWLFAEGFKEGRAVVQTAPGAGVIDKTGAWVVRPQEQRIYAYSDGLALTGREIDDVGTLTDCSYLDASGKVAMPGLFAGARSFSEGLAGITQDGSIWMFIDRTGKIAIGTHFQDVGEFGQGLAAVSVVSGSDSALHVWGYIDKTGAWVIQPRFASAETFGPGGLTRVSLSDQVYFYIDMTGKAVWPPASR
jgi:hypothetical protein